MSDSQKPWYLDESDEEFFEEDKQSEDLALTKSESAPISDSHIALLLEHVSQSRAPWSFVI
jgi:hypothetical protein